MKNQNETGGSGRKDEGVDRETPPVAAGATGMFEQPLAPSGEPAFDNPNAEFRAVTSASAPPASAQTHSSPGEFTRLFQAITPAAPAKAASPRSSPGVVPAEPVPSDSKPTDSKSVDSKTGEFTRIFMRLPKDPGAEPGSAMPMGTEISSGTGRSKESETGEFTRLMRGAELKSESPRTGPAPAVVPAPSSTPVRGFSTPGKNDAVSGSAGVTELFVTASPHPAPAPIPTAFPSQNEVSGRAGSPFQSGSLPRQEQSAGEFTQLFRALDSHPESIGEQRSEMPVPAAKPPDAQGGEFTQLMQSLSPERAREALGASSAQPGMDVAGAGARPGTTPSTIHADDAASFTRILSTSAAREEAARGMKSAADAQPPAASSAKESAPIPPVAAMPGMPRLPQAPSIPRPVAFGQQPAAAAPAPPVLPNPAPVAVPQSKLQAYLPLLLILNAFALAVLILLVIFALRRH